MSQACTTCLKTGPVLMPFRYAVVPDRVSQPLPAWAEPQSPFPSLHGYHYALRAMRQGFIYVFYDTGVAEENAAADWEAWSVAENGDIYFQGPTGLGATPLFNPLSCDRPQHAATNLEHMALNAKALKYETWVAFSHAPWTETTLKMYTTDSAARAARMQNIMPTEWLSHITLEQPGLTRASEDVLSTVLDYKMGGASDNPFRVLLDEERSAYRVSYIDEDKQTKQLSYHFYEESIRPHTTFHPWCKTRRGQASRSMQAINSRSLSPDGKPVIPLIMALQDPVGITHELAHWGDMFALAHQTYLDELSIEFATWRNINGVKDQVEQISQIQFDEEMNSLKDTNDYIGYRAYGKYKKYANDGYTLVTDMGKRQSDADKYPSEGTDYLNTDNKNIFREKNIAHNWKKCSDKLNQPQMQQFIEQYDWLCECIDGYSSTLVGLRLDWLQETRFIQCLDDHSTSLADDNLNYREIVGYAVASINVAEAGRKKIEEWINEYSTVHKTNLFWRSQFFNDPLIMDSVVTVLVKMKEESAKKDRPQKEEDKPAAMVLINSLMSNLNKYNEACDRAAEAIEKYAKSASQSPTRKIMLWGDNRLFTFSSTVFNHNILGRGIDSINEAMYKFIFAIDAGVEANTIRKHIKLQMDTGPQGASAFRRKIQAAKKTVETWKSTSNAYKESFEKMLVTEEGKVHTNVSRVKFLGVLLNIWELQKQIHENKKDIKSYSGILSALLFTASWSIQTVLPAYETIARVSRPSEGLVLNDILTRQEEKLSKWKIRAAFFGSRAAAFSVVVDLADFVEGFDKSGPARVKALGLASIKIISDGAYAIQVNDGLLNLLGKQSITEILTAIRINSTSFVSKKLAKLALQSISFLASWQVMVLVAIAPTVVATFSDDDLQNWIKHCVFGCKSQINNTELMSSEKRTSILLGQEDNLVLALHEVLNLPLSDKLQKEVDEKEKARKEQETKLVEVFHQSIPFLFNR